MLLINLVVIEAVRLVNQQPKTMAHMVKAVPKLVMDLVARRRVHLITAITAVSDLAGMVAIDLLVMVAPEVAAGMAVAAPVQMVLVMTIEVVAAALVIFIQAELPQTIRVVVR